jgi:hypothetical protein
MTEGHVPGERVPVVIEEEVEMARSWVEDVLQEGLKQTPVLSLESRVVGYPQEVGVPLQDVKQGVHGLAAVEISVAQARIREVSPVTAAPFDVATVDRVVPVLL